MKHKFWVFRTPLRVILIALAFNGLAIAAIVLYRFSQKGGRADLCVPIKAIVQTGPMKEALKTAYLAELIGLSVNRPILTVDFDTKDAEARLLASPVIKKVSVQIKEPGILYIDYSTRRPVALLADYENIALDGEGYPFPLTPFFSPKTLPKIYLDLTEEIQFNQPITGEKKELAFEIMNLVGGPIVRDLFNVTLIDVSNAFEESYGRREIVLKAEDEIFFSHNEREICFRLPRLLRLSTKSYSQDLGNYLKLREELLEKERDELFALQEVGSEVILKEKIIDFRIPQLAFIDVGDA